ncbi:MAG TPA: ADOP family duplicated permease [Longimicrobiales bacterium]|nr:ADOP family duplicated permease [Longimicrobiales bacterium]
MVHPILTDALRSLRRAPFLALFATVALGLGIAAPTTMFSIVDGVLRDVPVPRPHELVHVAGTHRDASTPRPWVSMTDVAALGEQARTMHVAAYSTIDVDISGGDEHAIERPAANLSPNLLDVLEVRPLLGRGFTEGDAVPGGPAVVLLGHDLWQARFGGDPRIVGRTIRVNGLPHEVVGVMPAGFRFPERHQIWAPLHVRSMDEAARVGGSYQVVARLKPGVGLERADAEADAIGRRLAAERPDTHEKRGLLAQPYAYTVVPANARVILKTMLLLVSFVLLVACANVANLLLARAVAAGRETAVRAALGASRRRIVVTHLAESGMVAAAGGVLGLAGARLGIVAFNRATQGQLAYWMDIRLDAAALLFATGAVALAALLAGLVPALQSSGVELNETLKEGGRGETGFRLGRLSRALVVVEVALSFTLLAVSGLMIKSMLVRLDAGGGYEAADVLTGRYTIRHGHYPERADRLRFHAGVLERLERVPGVERAALGSTLPGLGAPERPIEIEGRAYRAEGERPRTRVVSVTPAFFETFGVRVLRGRAFTDSDDDGAPMVALVNTAFAARHLPGTDPLGQRVRVTDFLAGPETGWATVVGIVPPMGLGSRAQGEEDGLYLPLAQTPYFNVTVAARVASGLSPTSLAPALRDAVAELDRDVAVTSIMTLEARIAERRQFDRVFSTLFLLFGLAALLLAAVGLYGVLAFSVSRRRRELGIRMALGASRGRVAWRATGAGVWQVGVGVLLGLALALTLAPVLGPAIEGVAPNDPGVYGVVILAMVVVGIVAAAVPARRAVGVEVGEVLRE